MRRRPFGDYATLGDAIPGSGAGVYTIWDDEGRSCLRRDRWAHFDSPSEPAQPVARRLNSSQVAEPRITPRTSLHPPIASGGNMYLQRSQRTSASGAFP